MKTISLIFALLAVQSIESAEAAIGKTPATAPNTGVSVLNIDVDCEQNDDLCSDFAKKAKVLWPQDGAQALIDARYRGSGTGTLKLEGVGSDDLAIDNGIRLGMSDAEVTGIMGRALEESNENGLIIRTYKNSRRTSCDSAYQAKYAFKDGKLQSYKVECEIR